MVYYHYNLSESIADWKVQEQVDVFITTLLRKQTAFLHAYQDDFFGVYFSRDELRAIFGKRQYLNRIKLLEGLGFETIPNLTNQYGKPIYFFQPFDEILKGTRFTIQNNVLTQNITSLRKSKKVNLSTEGKIILKNLKGLQFNCTTEEYLLVIASGYNAYVEKKTARKGNILTLDKYLRESLNFYKLVEGFNEATGYDYLDYIWEDTFGQRIHSIISCCPTSLKNSGYVLLNGKPITTIDMHQSQPTILAKTLHNEIGDNSFTNLFNEVDDIYLEIQNRFNLPSRLAAKIAMFEMLFGKPQSKMHKAFNTMFPDAGEWIIKLKSQWIANNPSKKKHSNLAFLMQRTESSIFRTIWKELDNEGIAFLTVHDSIECTQADTDKVIKIMTSIMNKHFIKFRLTKDKQLPSLSTGSNPYNLETIMSYDKNFRKDLAKGQQSEKELVDALIKLGYEAKLNPSSNYQNLCAYDIEFTAPDTTEPKRAELKTDFKSTTTGNVAIEYSFKDKPSGINSTEADYWVTRIEDKFYSIPVEKLKALLKQQRFIYKTVTGGAGWNSKLYLIKKDDFLKYNNLLAEYNTSKTDNIKNDENCDE